jgi:hypothetical protein
MIRDCGSGSNELLHTCPGVARIRGWFHEITVDKLGMLWHKS